MKPGNSRFSRPTTSKKVEKVQKKVTMPTIQGDNILQLIEQLISLQKECERTGKYVEAQGYKRKVKALREQADKKDLIDIKQRHQKQRQEIQQAHLEELNCFNIEWDEKFADLKQTVEQMEVQLAGKHEEQNKAVEEQLLAEKPVKFKESAQLLNLRHIQQQLARQENYMEAHQVQTKATKLQKQQIQKWKKEQGSKCRNNLSLLKQRQQSQLSALRQRIDLMFEQRIRQKTQEEEKIILKYQNVIKELQFQQKQQISKFQKSVKLSQVQKKTKAGMFSTSRVSMG